MMNRERTIGLFGVNTKLVVTLCFIVRVKGLSIDVAVDVKC